MHGTSLRSEAPNFSLTLLFELLKSLSIEMKMLIISPQSCSRPLLGAL